MNFFKSHHHFIPNHRHISYNKSEWSPSSSFRFSCHMSWANDHHVGHLSFISFKQKRIRNQNPIQTFLSYSIINIYTHHLIYTLIFVSRVTWMISSNNRIITMLHIMSHSVPILNFNLSPLNLHPKLLPLNSLIIIFLNFLFLTLK